MSVNARDWSRRRPFPVRVRLSLAAANDRRWYRRGYVSVCLKFVLALGLSLAWAIFAYVTAQHWMGEPATPGQRWMAHLLLIGSAVLPAFVHAFLAAGLLLDRRPPRSRFADTDFPAVTILIAAYNVQDGILDTLASIDAQRYPARIEVMVINDGSSDATLERLRSVSYPWLEVLDLRSAGGKANALNAGLRLASCPLTVTLDADAHLHPRALRHLVSRYMSDPPNTAAVAGAVLVRNSRQSLLARMQEWDYFQGIAASKRLQSLFQGTLIAPGTFSLYRTDILRVVGGWPSSAGEDAVLSWAILRDGHRVGYCEDAIAFARVPAALSPFLRQRRQWARGSIEAFRAHGSLLFRRRMSAFFIGLNLLFPYMDLACTIALLPAILLACTGVYWLAGAMLAFVLPVSLLANVVIFVVQTRTFDSLGLSVRRNPLGLFGYVLLYGLALKPASVAGCLAGLLERRQREHWD